MYESFTREEFEDFLRSLNVEFEPSFYKGEWHYTIRVFFKAGNEKIKTNKRIVVRSSVGHRGEAHGNSRNSIRAWVEYFNVKHSRWFPIRGAKGERSYVTRQQYWRKNLKEWLEELWRIAIEDTKKYNWKFAKAVEEYRRRVGAGV